MYDILSLLLILREPFIKIIMDFIIDLLLNISKSNVCDSILIIINRYIKLLKYLFTNKIINILNLINIIYRHVFFTFG